jgi:hypothetical protein
VTGRGKRLLDLTTSTLKTGIFLQRSIPLLITGTSQVTPGQRINAMSKIAHVEADPTANGGATKLTKVAMHATDRGADAARQSMQVAQRTATAIGERQQESVRQSAKDATELSQLFVQLFNEQARHNLQFVTAVAKAQGDFVRGSFERMSQLSGRYREIIQAGMKAMAFTART